ncbi:MAG: J domain-containing protein [Gammaproteobacteria bacterium WSBS_2016_MAG_OTU1]
MSSRPREVLGVGETAGRDEIVTAYRRLAMKWHPDRNQDPQAKVRFQEIQSAYQTLQAKLSPQNTRELWEDLVKNSEEEFSQELFDDGIIAQIPFVAVLFVGAGVAAFVLLERPGNIVLLSLAVWAANNAYKIGTTRFALQMESAFRLAVRCYFVGLLVWGVWALAHQVVE